MGTQVQAPKVDYTTHGFAPGGLPLDPAFYADNPYRLRPGQAGVSLDELRAREAVTGRTAP